MFWVVRNMKDGAYIHFFIDFIIIMLEIYVVGIEMYKGEISYTISSQWREDTGLFVLHEQKKTNKNCKLGLMLVSYLVLSLTRNSLWVIFQRGRKTQYFLEKAWQKLFLDESIGVDISE